MAYAALGRTEEASAGYSKALGLDPELAAARLNRGIHSYKFGRNADAVVDFEAALNSDPDRETRGRLHFILTLAQLA